jgi:hypothetical protein
VVPQLDPFPVTAESGEWWLHWTVGRHANRYSPFKRNCIPKRHGISTHGSYSGPCRQINVRVLLVLESVGSGEQGKQVEILFASAHLGGLSLGSRITQHGINEDMDQEAPLTHKGQERILKQNRVHDKGIATIV